MKKQLLFLFICIIVLGLTGCGKKEIIGPFTITCEGVDDYQEDLKQTNKSIYNFSQDQYVTNYEIQTVSVYSKKKTYETYKEEVLKTLESNDGSTIAYDVTTDDETKTIIFKYKKTINEEDLNALEDKDFYKAANVLERAKSGTNVKCTFDGVEESQIK